MVSPPTKKVVSNLKIVALNKLFYFVSCICDFYLIKYIQYALKMLILYFPIAFVGTLMQIHIGISTNIHRL